MSARSRPALRRVLVAIGALIVVALTASPAPAAADANEQPGAPVAVRSISAGSTHSCAVVDDGGVVCWGANPEGQLGLGDTINRGNVPLAGGATFQRVDLGAGRTATAVSAGGTHTCALLDNGQVKCWGENNVGQLGLGDLLDRGDDAGEMGDALPAVDLGAGRTATAVAAGSLHTCVILDTASVKCWGANALGQLGLGDTVPRGDNGGEMGDALPVVPLGTGRTVTAITAGLDHNCALLDTEQIKCWGANFVGQLGYGDTTDRGDNSLEMGGVLPTVSLGIGYTAQAISAGLVHTCALLGIDSSSGIVPTGRVKCWGGNSQGQLGQGDTVDRGDDPGEMGDNLAVIALGGARRAVALAAGGFHTCVLTTVGSVGCWGDNNDGQLGIGSNVLRGDDAGEMGGSLQLAAVSGTETALAVTGGSNHTCAIPQSGGVRCWGANSEGQLGTGDVFTRGDGPGEMGAALVSVPLPGGMLRPGVTVSLTAPASGIVGFAASVTVRVTNTSRRDLSGLVVVAPDAPGCAGPLPVIAAGASHDVFCLATTTADRVPATTVRAAVVGPGVLALSAPARITVSPVSRQPDVLVKKGSGTFVGNGVINTTGSGQRRKAKVPASTAVTFTVQIQNDGNTKNTFLLRGMGSTSRFTVTYRNGATDVTSAVVAGTFRTQTLGVGGTQDLVMSVLPRATSRVGDKFAGTVRVSSSVDPAAADAVQVVVTRR
jgi:alpha-tubulin suppressor-like RCC1 family protein